MNKTAEVLTFSFENTISERVDKFIAQEQDAYSRAQIQLWIKEGYLLVDGEKVKPNFKLQTGQRVTVHVPAPEKLSILAEPMDLDIIYEDEDVLVLNKSRGMVVHPAAGHTEGTLVNGLLDHCHDLSGINGILRPGIVHRIDKDTSGLLMVAKNDRAHLSLAEQLQAHTVNRSYVALVKGSFRHERGTVDAPIGRDPKNRQRMAVIEEGKRAVTHFEVLEQFDRYTYLSLRLETGRTHQIRVHMAYIGHPLVGDPKYGIHKRKDPHIEGQALHAQELGFTHPRSGERLHFQAPIPEDFERILLQLRGGAR